MDATHTAKLAELLRRDRNDVRAEIDFSLREILEPDEIERAGLYEGMDPSLFAMRACVRIHELEEFLKKGGVQRLVEAAKAVRDHVANADVLFEPVYFGSNVEQVDGEHLKVERAQDALEELCDALEEADSQ